MRSESAELSIAEVRHELQRELAPQEKLLWVGQPRQGLLLRSADAFLIPFSLLWGGFAVFWEASVVRTGAPFFFKLWGVPFVLVGVYIVLGRFFVDARQRRRTFYGVSNQRVIIVAGLFGRSIQSLDLGSLPGLSLDERTSGQGTISFGTGQWPYAWMQGTGWPTGRGRYAPCFDSIADARQVYELIRRAQRDVK
jgi:hypothetical protein